MTPKAAARRRTGVLGATLAVLSGLIPALAGQPPETGPRGPLDGLSFSGRFGVQGEPPDRTDTLHFRDGHFWSENCVPCGFAPGLYWVRRDGGRIHFRGELASAERGRFRFAGEVRGERIEVSINWQRERWYWTIDRDFRFTGSLAPEVDAPPLAEARQAAAAEAPPPGADCRP